MSQTRQWRNPRNGSTQRSAELGRGVRVPDGEQGEEFQLKEGESAAWSCSRNLPPVSQLSDKCSTFSLLHH